MKFSCILHFDVSFVFRFRHRPIGPIANFIKASGIATKYDDVAAVIEAHLGRSLLTSFIVNDRTDLGVLKKMLRGNGVNVSSIFLVSVF